MRVLVNGEETETRGAGNIAELVEQYQISPQTVLIEHNGVSLHSREWRQRILAEGDQIEIVRVVAGG